MHYVDDSGAEYMPYDNGYIRRQNAEAEWIKVPESEVPQEALDDFAAVKARKERVKKHGYDPSNPPRDPVVIRAHSLSNNGTG